MCHQSHKVAINPRCKNTAGICHSLQSLLPIDTNLASSEHRWPNTKQYSAYMAYNMAMATSKFKGKCWVPLGGYLSSCSPIITPCCPIDPLYNPYIGGICWYICRVLSQGYPTFPFEKYHNLHKSNHIKYWWVLLGPQIPSRKPHIKRCIAEVFHLNASLHHSPVSGWISCCKSSTAQSL